MNISDNLIGTPAYRAVENAVLTVLPVVTALIVFALIELDVIKFG